MRFVSYAQNMEDVLLWRALRNVKAGFYIDVGAGDPRRNSVTLAFYERGWHGININSDTARLNAFKATRPRDINLELATAAEADQADHSRFSNTGWSASSTDVTSLYQVEELLPNEAVVETLTLSALCKSRVDDEVHFLRLDLKHAEARLIASSDFIQYRPWIILVKAASPELAARERGPTLAVGDYKFAQLDGSNCYYVALEHAARLLPTLAAPVNASDNYVPIERMRHARATADDGAPLPGGASSIILEEATQRASETEQRTLQAEAEARRSELRALPRKVQVQSLRAEDARRRSLDPAHRRQADEPAINVAEPQPKARRIFFDATLMLRWGLVSAVGIVRVEHYVAEYLAEDTALALDFVVYDSKGSSYRRTTAQEQEILEYILFHRHDAPPADPPERPGKRGAPDAARAATSADAATVAPKPRKRHRLIPAKALTQAEFIVRLNQFALRHIPVLPAHSPPRRVAIRLLRRLLLAAARLGHRHVAAATTIYRQVATCANRLVAPDPDPASGPRVGAPNATGDAAPPAAELYDPFEPGDMLISIANTCDYMDYSYLAMIVREKRVRLIAVVHDVVGVELPFVTPSPAHVWHRHWVEIGHVAERVIAISRFSADSYDRFIAQPNGIDVQVDHAPLPNFLQHRAAEIGESAVNELDGRNFVIYCATIEIRKNHVLLLNLWEELRQRVAPEKLPVLVFVGKWGWSAETVRLVVERNWRLRRCLRVLDNVPDTQLIWLYRHARFTVFPSLREGFGSAASESLSFGTPVVISHCPALLETTEYLMPAFHPHDFVGWLHEMERLILNDDYLESLRETAKRFRGPAYTTFAKKIHDAALAAP